MKKISGILCIIASFAIISCNSGNKDKEAKSDSLKTVSTDSAKTGKKDIEYTAKYVCPMHCKGSGSDKTGKCTSCGMDLIENPNPK